ncbi:unnamed protein product [Lathyrus sativus]|nr:unnamed protein product [Lathyrus sativus]
MRLTEIKLEKEREAMRNSIRCCISCILPCGALDVVRIVHCNGRVEEISGTVKASEIMKAYPKHVLKKPSSSSEDGVVPKIVVVPPDADLQRGKIYFLMPLPSPPAEKNNHRHGKNSSNGRKKRKEDNNNNSTIATTNNNIGNSGLVVSSDQYLTEILSEKLSCQRDRRRGRVAVWRPHLESISESPNHL